MLPYYSRENKLSMSMFNVCELSTGEDMSWEKIISLKDQSGYIFESFQSISIDQNTGEENKSLWASKQVDDISLEDFVSALQAINQTADALMKGNAEVPENFISQYEKLVESEPKTPKTLFSYEQFTKNLEDIYLKKETMTAEVGKEYDSIISQYKVDQVSRKAFFFEKVKESLLGLVMLSEEVSKHQSDSKRTLLPIRNSITEAKEEDKAGKLLLSEREAISIRQLYEIFLAWNFLYGNITQELQDGFELDREIIEVVQREMTEAKAEMQRWFHNTGIKHDWEYREGYNIAVDFESSINISSACYQKIWHRSPELENKNWIPVMKLDGIEKEVIERLTMLVQTFLSNVKDCLVQHLTGMGTERDLEVAVKMLGHSVLNMSRWYREISREHNWPQYLNWRVTSDWIVEGR